MLVGEREYESFHFETQCVGILRIFHVALSVGSREQRMKNDDRLVQIPNKYTTYIALGLRAR